MAPAFEDKKNDSIPLCLRLIGVVFLRVKRTRKLIVPKAHLSGNLTHKKSRCMWHRPSRIKRATLFRASKHQRGCFKNWLLDRYGTLCKMVIDTMYSADHMPAFRYI